MTERRPWLRALGWIALLGPFFFASYGFANWLASERETVGVVVFGWERAIPFLPWTVLPYWSIDLLYGVSLLVCTTRRELDRQAQRLLLVQLVAVSCFLLFPLRFSFERPEVGGVWGAMFQALGAFDKPFNQAPSLHIALLVVVWVCLERHSPGLWSWVLHGWMALIGLSVLTTYQHHFIDLPTGLALGFFALWTLPMDADSPLSGLTFARDPARRRLAAIYWFLALATGAPTLAGGAWLWLAWPACSLAIVALNYSMIGPRGFQKLPDGGMSVGAYGLLAPYLALAWLNSRLWTFRQPSPVEVTEGVFLGRIPSGREFATSPMSGVVDLAAELPCGRRRGMEYRNRPVLDLTVPSSEDLEAAAREIETLRQAGPVLVCCALGYSRSATAVAAWLLSTRRADSVDAAVELIRHVKPSIVLTDRHRNRLQGFV